MMDLEVFVEERMPQEAARFLSARKAEQEFELTLGLIHECFPDLQSVEAELVEDPDEEGRQRIVFGVSLPHSLAPEAVVTLERAFAERLVERLPPQRFPDPVCTFELRMTRDQE